jgi:RNA polymerase sigma-70 factor (ECF subfamily)
MGQDMRTASAAEFDTDVPQVAAIGVGDRLAFEEFLRRHDPWVRAVIYGVLGDRDALDDVAQHAWTLVWQRAAELRDPRCWRAWLYRLVRNAALDFGRDATRRRKRGQSDVGLEAASVGDRSDAGLDLREQHRAVLSAIEALPVLYREPFVLRHVNGWNYQQIAEVMEMPVDSIETRLVRARRLLRQALRGQLD